MRRGWLWHHCGWCQPITTGWRRVVQRLGIRWTTGICDRCSLRQYRRLVAGEMRRVRHLEERVQRLEEATCTPMSA